MKVLVGVEMWTKLLLYIALVSQAASTKILNVDYPENVRDLHQSRIVSGWDAYLGQYPYQVSLRAINQLGQLLGCGGSVIHENWVITAAHCTADYRQITVRAGLIEIYSAEYVSDSWEWYNYPTFISNQPNAVQPNDVALIRLTDPMTFTSNLQRVQIQSSDDAFRAYTEEKLIASGWGRTWTSGPTSVNLQWTYLRGVDNMECSRLFGSRIVNSNTICARWYNITSQSVCQGDSGGPLVQVDSNGTPILVGVTSFVAGTSGGGCHSGHPGGFIRPGPFHSWFQEITGINFELLNDESNPKPEPTPEPTTTTPEPTTTTPEPTTTTPEPTTTTPKPTTTTTVPSTTTPISSPDPTTTTTLAPTTSEAPESDSDSESDEDEDDEMSELLKKLQVKVKVVVNLKKYKKVGGKVKEVEEVQYL